MDRNDTTDFVAALAFGAVLGAATVLLLRTARGGRSRRVAKDLRPYRRKMRKSAKRARKGLVQTADATAELREELAAASRTVVRDFQEELAELLAGARGELARAVDEQTEEARKALSRSVQRLREG